MAGLHRGALLALLIVAPAAAQPPASVAIPQIRGGATARSDQVSPGSQVSAGAQAPTAAQVPAATGGGRSVSIPAVTGRDGCDPGSALANSEVCQQRIETRADQYGAPGAAPVTAEGRLLILTSPAQTGGTDSGDRLGDGSRTLQDFVGDAAGQVASVLQQQKPAPGEPSPFPGAPSGVPATVVINPGH